jgi:curved DNA-binding protein CbpA
VHHRVSSLHRSYVPRVNPACDVRRLTISPYEAYILSRIDGVSSATELGLITGLGDDLLPILQRLFTLGALTEAPPGQAATSPPPPPPSQTLPPGPLLAAPQPLPPSSGRRRPAVPQSELEEEVELPPERRRQILELYYSLDELTHYELLGVEPNADKKAIKDAYGHLVKIVHTDSYFGKKLGSYKSKMEILFRRITEAEQTLTRNQTRREYDAELARKPLRRTSGVQAAKSLHNSINLPVSKPSTIPPPPPPPVITTTPATPPPPPASSCPPPASPSPAPFPREPVSSVVRRSDTPTSADERRRVLAARLSGKWSTKPPAGASPAPPEAQAPHAAANARESLRRMAISHQIEQQRGQLDRYLRSAEECAARNDAVGAANAYRLAASHSPDDERIQVLLREWSAKAVIAQAEQNLQNGSVAAAQGRWSEAAQFFTKAASGRPDDPVVLAKAAHALVQSGGDLHLAAELARRAVSLCGGEARYRITLAEVYLAAGLGLNARRELAEAARIEPANPKVKELLKGIG